MRMITATVAYPVTVMTTITDLEASAIEQGNFMVAEKIRKRIKDVADESFETSTIKPVLIEADLEGLAE